jgi:hypothetical protein
LKEKKFKSFNYKGGAIAFLIFLLFSCRKEDTINSTISAIPDANYISSQSALRISANLLEAESIKLSNSNFKGIDTEVKDVKSIKAYQAKDNLNVFYVVNYKEGGFAILSADKRTPSVLAYSETNSFNTDTDLPPGLSEWMEGIKTNISDIRKKNIKYIGQDNLIINRIAKVDNMKGKNISIKPFEKNNIVTQNGKLSVLPPDEPPVECESFSTYTEPLIQTTWGQGSGYNNSFPYISGVGTGNGRAYTGCMATAMGQIIRYHQYPNTYNYSIMPNKVTYANELSSGTNEMSDMLYAAAQSMGMSYTSTSSGAYNSNLIWAFKNIFNYSNDINEITFPQTNSSLSLMKNQIDMNRPFIMTGIQSNANAGHAWVVDGYQMYYHCMENGLYAGYLSFYMNWGWMEQFSTDSYDAYYVMSYVNPEGPGVEPFQSIKAIIDIHH